MTDPDKLRAFADLVVQRAFAVMQQEGVPHELAIDRIATFTALAVGLEQGKAAAVAGFRRLADNIEAGALDFYFDEAAGTSH